MTRQFSTELKEELIILFKEDYSLDISDGEAEILLTALANLYGSYKKLLTEYFELVGEEKLDRMDI